MEVAGSRLGAAAELDAAADGAADAAAPNAKPPLPKGGALLPNTLLLVPPDDAAEPKPAPSLVFDCAPPKPNGFEADGDAAGGLRVLPGPVTGRALLLPPNAVLKLNSGGLLPEEAAAPPLPGSPSRPPLPPAAVLLPAVLKLNAGMGGSLLLPNSVSDWEAGVGMPFRKSATLDDCWCCGWLAPAGAPLPAGWLAGVPEAAPPPLLPAVPKPLEGCRLGASLKALPNPFALLFGAAAPAASSASSCFPSSSSSMTSENSDSSSYGAVQNILQIRGGGTYAATLQSVLSLMHTGAQVQEIRAFACVR